jgi:hypothetical protein
MTVRMVPGREEMNVEDAVGSNVLMIRLCRWREGAGAEFDGATPAKALTRAGAVAP